MTMAALVLTNLLYLAGAVAVASLLSGLYVLRHRKPKSLESGIESFSRELRALAPERHGGADPSESASPSADAPPAVPRVRPAIQDGAIRLPAGGSVAIKTGRRIGVHARAEPTVSSRLESDPEQPGQVGAESSPPALAAESEAAEPGPTETGLLGNGDDQATGGSSG
jgi:hypothetical protein